MKKMIKRIKLFAISLVLMSCINQVPATNDVIVLGVIRTMLNLSDTYTIGTNGIGTVKMQLPADVLDGENKKLIEDLINGQYGQP